jgi:soluble lytic murein transglycosylase-like protein
MTALLLATMLLMRPTAPTPLGRAIEHVESRGNPLAVSPVGARGLWQVMPGRRKGAGLAPACAGCRSR